MNPCEADTQVFILRIWFEPREIEGAIQKWRGVIEFIPTGEKRYFKRLDEVEWIINYFLGGSDNRPGVKYVFCRWLKQLTSRKS